MCSQSIFSITGKIRVSIFSHGIFLKEVPLQWFFSKLHQSTTWIPWRHCSFKNHKRSNYISKISSFQSSKDNVVMKRMSKSTNLHWFGLAWLSKFLEQKEDGTWIILIWVRFPGLRVCHSVSHSGESWSTIRLYLCNL